MEIGRIHRRPEEAFTSTSFCGANPSDFYPTRAGRINAFATERAFNSALSETPPTDSRRSAQIRFRCGFEAETWI